MIFRLLQAIFAVPMVLLGMHIDTSDDITYLLTTSKEVITVNLDHNLDKLNPNIMTHFIVHGWAGNVNGTQISNTAAELIKYRSPCNVIRVDYSPIADMNYFSAYLGAYPVGNSISDFVYGLIKKHNFKHELFHFIGHSMGAHVVGFIGKDIYKRTGVKIGWITGLDPARPGYEIPRPSTLLHLTKKDAEFVDVVHTDAGGLGYKYSVGQVDFYVNNNGRRVQPGCPLSNSSGSHNTTSVWDWIRPNQIECSHMRSFMYYTESIYTKTLATECDNYSDLKEGKCANKKKIVFGLDVPHNATGNFYFNTTDRSPFLIPTA